MHILAVEPYYDGSHKAFIDNLLKHSKHKFTLLAMPAYKWKWRMRGAAVWLAWQAKSLIEAGNRYDGVFCSDMLNLAEFRGLSPVQIASLPSIAYFHENQITYPCRVKESRDVHFAFTNITTALSAGAVWFNSHYHKDAFLGGAAEVLSRMPDYKCLESIEIIKNKSFVIYPCISDATPCFTAGRPLKIIWSARWEHDKNPDDFFAALRLLRKMGVDFRVSVTGQSFSDIPPVFAAAKDEFAPMIDCWGFIQDGGAYRAELRKADIFVSTAIHEFFGISAVEAAAAGCCVMVPRRLAYPEVFDGIDGVFYDGTPQNLAQKLAFLSKNTNELSNLALNCCTISKKYAWETNIDIIDKLIEDTVNGVL